MQVQKIKEAKELFLSKVYKWQEKKVLRKKGLLIKSLTWDSGYSSHLSLMPKTHSQQEVPYIFVNTVLLKGTIQYTIS